MADRQAQQATTEVFEGRIAVRDRGDASDILFLGHDSPPLAEQFRDALGGEKRQVSLRYFISADPLAEDQRTDALVRAAVGEGLGEYVDVYSDVTGHLWTDEAMKVGGHDLLDELRSHAGQWCRLEVTIHA